MTEEIRPICLYIETCLDRKEGTRDCAKCEHHLNYWTEVMIRDMEKNITRLEQENKELRAEIESFMNGDYCADGCKKMNNAFCDAHTAIINENNKLRSALKEIKSLVRGHKVADEVRLKSILDKINEVLE